jgi:redox-sensitive bicupin YhaK (pirin superfamily)
MRERTVVREVTGHATEDGAGVKLTRVLGIRTVEDFDPFLMLDAFDSTCPDDYTKGFPWHPHRGIETVTYLVTGDIEHSDNMGNRGSIRNGECQWMTAGSGVIHQEMPKACDHMMGAQLWINLPAKEKMTAPKYNSITADSVPEVQKDGAGIRVVAGDYEGTAGAFHGDFVDATYLDVKLEPDTEWTFRSAPEETLFVYIFEGSGYFGKPYGGELSARCALLFGEGDAASIRSGADGLRFILLSGRPLKEPVAWGGPVVMNTEEELKQAFAELDNNTFIRE